MGHMVYGDGSGYRRTVEYLLTRLAALSGLLLAFWLRIRDLGGESLWYDETVSVYLASLDARALIAHTAGDIHPPGYYLLLHAWRWLAAPSLAHGLEFLYTWPSLWFGLLVVALTGAIAARLGGRWAGVMASFLAAVNPFQIMYAQEARMYSLGATCLLVTLAAALHVLRARETALPRLHRSLAGALILYIIAALAGLYTLYYFLFWLAVLIPLIALALSVALSVPAQGTTSHHTRRLLTYWLAVQGIVLTGWLPWLPIFWRQAVEPPVPPWRLPWTDGAGFVAALLEGLAALLVGQSSPGGLVWFWGVLVLFVVLLHYRYAKKLARDSSWLGIVLLPILALAPAALIYTMSLIWTPLYHVRYLVTYAPIFLILAGLLLSLLARRSYPATAIMSLLLIGASLAGISAYRQDPALRADDHRAAVAELAHNWRPGDVILVNAGWVYTALAVYWPDTLASPLDTAPPSIAALPRLISFSDSSLSDTPAARTDAPWPAVLVVRGGSVDGAPSLGWGDSASDFYAISAQETVNALDTLAVGYRRIWHYRLYDTVSDPSGVIRHWFTELGTPFFESTYPGPGFLRVEGVMARGLLPSLPVTAQHNTRFGDHVELLRHQTAAISPAGSMLYVALEWRWLVDRPDEEIAASVRLYGPGSEMIAQADTPLAPSLSATVLGLAPPAATPPGDYALGLIVYRRSDLAPLAIHNRTYQQQTVDDTLATGPAWPLGHVTLTLPASTPPTRMALGRFDYIELVEANVPQIAEAGSEANLELVWLPRPSAYRDNYTVKVAIQPIGEPGGTITVAEAPLGSPQYPSVHWTAGYAVRQLLSLSLSASLAPGTYSVHTALERSSDGLPIPARARWRIFTAPALEIGTIAIAR